MSDDTYFFEVSVAEHPQTKKQMNDLAKAVIDAQKEMSDAVSLVGAAAEASTAKLDGMLGVFDGFASGAQTSIKAVQTEVRALQELARQKVTQVVEVVHQQSGVPVAVGGGGGDALAPNPAPATAPRQQQFTDELHDSMLKEKAIYEQKVENQKVAFEKAAAEYDKAVETQHRSAEEMNKAVLKGARGLLDAAKGWTQLGLIGEENSKKLLESLIYVEGAFNIAKGGIEFLEAFGQGWKAIKNSQEAANNVAKITSALRSTEFAQLRAYNISLVQEAQAASVAAAANGRLAASRTAAGVAAGTGAAATAAGAAATTAGAGAATVGGAGAAMAGGAATAGMTTFAGVAVGAAGTIAAFAAAALGAGFGLRALYDVVTGTGKEVGSFNDTIATWEVQVFSAAAGMVGFTTSVAASQKQLADAEERSLKLRAEVDKQYADENTKRDGANQLARASFSSRNQIRSIDAGDDKDDQLAAADEKRRDAVFQLAIQEGKLAELKAQNLQHTEAYLDAEREAIFYRKELSAAITEQGKVESEITKQEIDGQKKVQEEIKKKIEESKKGLENLEKSQQSAVENFAKLDKVQQVTAIKALDKARASGGASLTDKEKDLLRSVGTDEAKRLASEGDKAEANAVGFDRTFGSEFDAERNAMAATQKSLEADLEMKYAVTIKTESNLDSALAELTDAARTVVEDQHNLTVDAVNKVVNDGLAKNRQEYEQKLKTSNKQRG
jgi:hypothetical protein